MASALLAEWPGRLVTEVRDGSGGQLLAVGTLSVPRHGTVIPFSAAHWVDRRDAVTNIRHLFQQTMEKDFREAVERLTGRSVVAFISGNHVPPDIAAELFILDEPI